LEFGTDPEGLLLNVGADGPPENETEETICDLYKKVLGRASISRLSNFFDSGGHSLLVTLLCTKVSSAFQREVRASDVFNFPTPAALAIRVQVLLENEEAPEETDNLIRQSWDLPTHFNFNPMPGKPTLFCVPVSEGLGTVFYKLAMQSTDFNVVALNDPQLRGDAPINEGEPTKSGLLDLAEKFYQQIEQIDRDMAQAEDESMGPLS
jgi:hypothetical protein